MPSRATLIRWGWRVAGLPPAVVARGVARVVGEFAWMIDRRRRAALDENLRYLRPDLDRRARQHLVRSTFTHFAACTADFLRFPSLTRSDLLALAHAQGLDALDRALTGGHGAIIVAAHLGGFDLGIVGIGALGYPVHVVVERLSPELQEAYAQVRASTGVRLIPLGDHEQAIADVLARGEILATGADRVRSGRSMTVPFGSGWRAVPTGPAALSLAHGAPLLTAFVVRTGAWPPYLGRIEPLEPDGLRTVESLTLAMAARFVEQIRTHPDQWFSFGRDWLAPPGSAGSRGNGPAHAPLV